MPPVSVNKIGEYIREQREQAKISLRQLSQQAGVSNPYLSQIERGLRKPSAEILQQIAKGLRISAEALYVQAGILEDQPADSGVRSALLADPALSERQKQVLIEIYESFRKENGVTGVRAGAGSALAVVPDAITDGAEATVTGEPAGDPGDDPGPWAGAEVWAGLAEEAEAEDAESGAPAGPGDDSGDPAGPRRGRARRIAAGTWAEATSDDDGPAGPAEPRD